MIHEIELDETDRVWLNRDIARIRELSFEIFQIHFKINSEIESLGRFLKQKGLQGTERRGE